MNFKDHVEMILNLAKYHEKTGIVLRHKDVVETMTLRLYHDVYLEIKLITEITDNVRTEGTMIVRGKRIPYYTRTWGKTSHHNYGVLLGDFLGHWVKGIVLELFKDGRLKTREGKRIKPSENTYLEHPCIDVMIGLIDRPEWENYGFGFTVEDLRNMTIYPDLTPYRSGPNVSAGKEAFV